MASFSGKQCPGASRDLKALKRQEAEMRNAAYRKQLEDPATFVEIMQNMADAAFKAAAAIGGVSSAAKAATA